MISTNNYESVKIHITTYKPKQCKEEEMSEDANRRNKNNTRFICSICLNTKPEERNNDEHNLANGKRKLSCPVCFKSCDFCDDGNTTNNRHDFDSTKLNSNNVSTSKVVQTSQTDISQGLNLLNEVLTVFQTKKYDFPKEVSNKTVIYKDVSVSTEFLSDKNAPKQNLSMSKVFKFSIDDEERIREHPKFVVLNSCQPEVLTPTLSISKHKSSSIPQMKLEELKYSLKEKSKSKDAIEEVNRMFATVSKVSDRETADDNNRPMIRNGPRVLPVVKTKNYEGPAKIDTGYCEMESPRRNSYKCCQTSNFCLPGGDSKTCCCKTEKQDSDVARCDKCVYMLSCHNKHKVRTGVMICACCKRRNKEYCSHNDG